MGLLYTLGICLYGLAIRLAALFQPKARQWVRGRKGLLSKIEKDLETIPKERRSRMIWFHCASLGEFEQGRPVMEALRERYPDCYIAVTFFSPSGFEVRKNTPVADGVWYLPLDTPSNAARMVKLIRPAMVFLVKYEYWFNLLQTLHRKEIPVFVISAVFRPGQLFFRSYGRWFLGHLKRVTWIFLQNGSQKALLERHGVRNFTVTGDTRFDRVAATAGRPREYPEVARFCSGHRILIGGSTWPEDEALVLPLIVNRKVPLKYILAPHEVNEQRLRSLEESIRNTPGMPVGRQAIVRLSELTGSHAKRAKVLVVDSIGHLAHLYRYADFALIGGAFGSGLHNILEAVVFGKPVLFGPHYEKFPEASELIRLGGAVSVRDPEEARDFIRRLLSDPVHTRHMSETCRIFAESNQGSTGRILDAIRNFGLMPRVFSS